MYILPYLTIFIVMYTTKLYSRVISVLLFIVVGIVASKAQPCTTTNAAGCFCEDGSLSCALLPDITISWYALENYANGPTEYSQTGNGVDNGRLRVTGSTPNIGFGPFTVRGTDYFLCGTDTIYDPTRSITSCPNGDLPTNLLQQRIYNKDTANMTYVDRWAGGQTYHPGHGHNHVDDWVTFTLRKEDPLEPDTLQWPIIGTGAKIGFCLMDLSNCNVSNGHCRDVQSYGQGNILTSADFPNYGLGGGAYSCSPVEQGISVGYVDIYSEGLEGMWIDIPPGTCNGDYWIVVEVDPRNNFLESNENNNWTAIPFELTQQVANGAVATELYTDTEPILCNNSLVTITPSITANSYLWSNGDTTPYLVVADTGHYYVDVFTDCGAARSDTVYVTRAWSQVNQVIGDTLCEPNSAELFADADGTVKWYNSPTNVNSIASGNRYSTGVLNSSTTFYVTNETSIPGITSHVGELHHAGSDYSASNYNGNMNFDVLTDLILESVTVMTDFPGERIIELRDINGTVLLDTLVNIDTGTTTVGLGFHITAGTDYQLGTNGAHNIFIFGDVSPELKRSDSGVTYPYEAAGLLNITSSSIGNSFYYYFYDWVVTTLPGTCRSPRMPVDVLVANTPNISLLPNVDTSMLETDPPQTIRINPSGGDLIGPGVTEDNGTYTFDPAAAGVSSGHQLTYTYTDNLGCTTTKTFNFEVLADTTNTSIGIAQTNIDLPIKIYPNPTTDKLYIDAERGLVKLSVYNITGKQVLSAAINNGTGSFSIDIQDQIPGMYLVKINTANSSIVKKINKK